MLHLYWDAVLFRIGEQLFTREQIPLAPRRNDFDIRVQRIGAELKAHLIIALAGRAVRDGAGTGHGSNFDQALGDQRARD